MRGLLARWLGVGLSLQPALATPRIKPSGPRETIVAPSVDGCFSLVFSSKRESEHRDAQRPRLLLRVEFDPG